MATLSAGAQPATRPRVRARTYSLASFSSRISQTESVFEVARAHSTSQRPDTQDAYGSFIPVRSATSSLKDFMSCYPSFATYRSSQKKRRKVTFTFDNIPSTSVPYRNDSDSDEPPSPDIPHRSFAPPSPTSSSSLRSASDVPSDLHPILASLERHSRLCSQAMQCSSCGKEGRDFPSCARCGARWCSRPCRLVGGKRHVC